MYRHLSHNMLQIKVILNFNFWPTHYIWKVCRTTLLEIIPYVRFVYGLVEYCINKNMSIIIYATYIPIDFNVLWLK